MSDQINYFAFGSNLNHYRIHQRIGNFKTLGIAQLKNHQLVFHKCGGDQSGKCTVVARPDHNVWGVVYVLNRAQKEQLDYFEGVGHGYSAVYYDIEHQGETINSLLYQAQLDAMDEGLLPFDWYKAYVLSGAMYHQLPEDYIDFIKNTPSICDTNQQRSEENAMILKGVY